MLSLLYTGWNRDFTMLCNWAKVTGSQQSLYSKSIFPLIFPLLDEE